MLYVAPGSQWDGDLFKVGEEDEGQINICSMYHTAQNIWSKKASEKGKKEKERAENLDFRNFK